MDEKMNREEAAAFLHESKPWRKMNEGEKLEWCDRAKKLIHQGYIQDDIAAFAGCSSANVRDRFRKSEALSGNARDEAIKKQQANVERDRISRAKRAVEENPEIILGDPKLRKIIGNAFEPEPLEPVTGRNKKVIEDQQPGEILLSKFYAWYIQGKALLPMAQESGKLNKAGRDDLEETAELVRALVDLVITAGTAGDWDEELAALVEGAA